MRLKYFFSYSRHDGDFVKQLARDLKIRNMDVWLDQLDIPVGAKWDTCIEHALNEAAGIILVLSKSSVQSDNVMDEVSYAINKSKHIIPILLDDCEVPFRVARIQQIDFKTDYSKGIEAIIATVYAHSNTNIGPPITDTKVVKPPVAKPVTPSFADHGALRIQDTTNTIKTSHDPYKGAKRKKWIKYALLIAAGIALVFLCMRLFTSSSGNELYSQLSDSITDSDYLGKEKSVPGILVIVIVGAIAGWIAGMIVDAGRQSLLLDVVIGIVGGYIASKWIFHGTLRLTGYYYVNLTITATVGAAILAAVIKIIRRSVLG